MNVSFIRKASSGLLFSLAMLSGSGSVAASDKLIVAHDMWVGYSGFFVAKAKGFFKEVDLEIETVEFSGPGDTVPPLVAGHVDIALTTLYNLSLATGKGAGGLKAIYLLDTSDGADAIVASPEIASIEDLKGKKIAVTTGEVNHLLLIAALNKAGIKESEVKLVNMNADDAGAAFIAGQVDAAVTWEPWVTKAKSAGGEAIFTSADTPDLILDGIVVTDATLAKKRDELIRFIKAVDKGVLYLRANPIESHSHVAEALGVSSQEAADMLLGDKVYDIIDNKILLAAGGSGYGSLEAVIEFLSEQSLIDAKFDGSNLLTKDLLP
jgi:NitT/TauT family transport system substrate-binding protein